MRESLRKVRQHLLTGVSYMIPFVACGGILIAGGLAFSPAGATGLEPPPGSWQELACRIGAAAFTLMLPVLGGYIAYAIAGKPGLVPGFVGGLLAAEIKAGFLGAILIGFVAGWIVEAMKQIPVPRYFRPIMPILVIPIVSGGLVGLLMLGFLGPPIANLMALLTGWLGALSTGSAVALAMVLGAMIAFDMGGPVNKVAFLFGAAMIKEGNYAVMGACAAAICTPPLGMGLATLVRRSVWSDDEREAGKAALAMGMIGITEGAIPLAASDPLRVIPSIMVGSMVAATVAMLGRVGDPAPHGGPIVLPVVDGKLMYIVAIVAGTIVTALMIHVLKRRSPAAAPGSEATA